MSVGNIVDILFVITALLLIFNGLRNGALFSLISLLALPLGFAVAYFFGPRFTILLASSGLPATPLIAYAVLFIGTILIVHILGNLLRSVLKVIPLFGAFDTLLGGVIGFVEAWLIWLILLLILGTFLNDLQAGTNVFSGVDLTQLGIHFNDWHVKDWYTFYNYAVTQSVFAHVNSFFVKAVPVIQGPPTIK